MELKRTNRHADERNWGKEQTRVSTKQFAGKLEAKFGTSDLGFDTGNKPSDRNTPTKFYQTAQAAYAQSGSFQEPELGTPTQVVIASQPVEIESSIKTKESLAEHTLQEVQRWIDDYHELTSTQKERIIDMAYEYYIDFVDFSSINPIDALYLYALENYARGRGKSEIADNVTDRLSDYKHKFSFNPEVASRAGDTDVELNLQKAKELLNKRESNLRKSIENSNMDANEEVREEAIEESLAQYLYMLLPNIRL